MKDYKEFPKPEYIQTKNKKSSSWLIFLIIGLLIGFATMFLITEGGLSGYHVTNETCTKLVNQSSYMAYAQGVYDTSTFVLNQGLLPIFRNESGTFVVEYLNLSGPQNSK